MRIALLSYRSKPHCGGRGIYIRHLSRELVNLGHEVEVFSGQPYPELDEGVVLTEVPSLDLYREPDPFRTPKPSEFRDLIDVEEVLTMWTAGFPEPKTFSSRVARLLKDRVDDFDIAHDNRCPWATACSRSRRWGCRSSPRSTTRSASTVASTSRPRRHGARSSRCAGGTASCACRPRSPAGRARS
ncbi:glycosyltransferase [Nocardioides sp. B-3]|uniref:glycosyltransferase family 4 protein n=1 Tax=Nocardioides sp. B-3 TaxID=2895565 RepID=UPI003FA55CC3